jgi:RNA-directed DNA polymerase
MRRSQEASRASELTSIWFLITREFGQPPKEVKQMTAETADAAPQAGESTNAGATSHLTTDWHAIDWYQAHENVRRLQARIVKATQEQKWGKVKAVQRLLTHSFSGKVLAVKRVTENQGKNTPGVDRITWNTPQKKINAVYSLRQRDYHPQPLRRIYIPKKNGKMRPLSIPCMRCRAMQALYLLALSPVAEVTGDRNSYGFRPERSTADAIEQCFTVLAPKRSAQWVLEGDIRACFDKISHDWLIAHIPMEKPMLKKWLKAGFMEKHTLHPTDEGTPQGGIASPIIANMALDGLEKLLNDRFPKPKNGYNAKVNFVRFADDFIVTGDSEAILEKEVKPLVEEFLRVRGLELSPEKTVTTHIEEGFDFLGQNTRKYDGKLLIRPSKKNVAAFLDKVRKIIEDNKQATAGNLIVQLVPLIQGWARYHQHVASKRTFKKVDHRIFCMLWSWAKRRHPKKGAKWVKARYFHSRGLRNWVFYGETTDNKGTHQVQLPLTFQTRIKRHVKVREQANPYDPEWETYFEKRLDLKMDTNLKHRKKLLHLWQEQKGLCPICQQKITRLTGWHSHHITWRSKGGSDTMENRVLLHPNCHSQVHSQGLSVVKPRPIKGAEREA